MRYFTPAGWEDIWPGHFKGKRLSLQEAATVYAWPSTGGRFELRDPSAFELDVLGIGNHFVEANCSANFAEEDTFVRKLRLLGGTFYEHSYLVRDYESSAEEAYTWLGWPEDEPHAGGVWILQAKRNEMAERRTARIRLARTMQERCEAIELCRGTFYPSSTAEHLVPMEPRPSVDRKGAEQLQQRREESENEQRESDTKRHEL